MKTDGWMLHMCNECLCQLKQIGSHFVLKLKINSIQSFSKDS